MTGEIYADVSEHNPPLSSAYPRKFVMFRLVNEFGHIDTNARANIATALRMRSAGQLVNFGGYVNPGHIANSTVLAQIRALSFPADAQIMLDVEAWPNDKGVPLISGDHSVGLTALANALRTRQQGRADLVTAYGNRHDLAALFRSRPAWLGLAVAGYNTNDPSDEYASLGAWQYTNGVENHTPWPSASAPFGHCDHNRLYVSIPSPEDELTITAKEIAEAVVAEPIENTLVEGGLSEPLGTRVLKAQAYANAAQTAAKQAVATAAATQELVAQIVSGATVIDYDRIDNGVKAALATLHLELG
jgi:hypothetical protein